ncbi:MAG TPA: ABC transporter ATP-binding protein [Alphaproteobacteria bacterium]|nr:ABC transporter ATP-binding protein [Alphaproteobacteria bacterium]
MSLIVKIDGLSKSFATGLAIESVSFGAEENEFVSIVGPSGCGKSTLLRIIAGLIPPSGGQICVRGQKVRAPISDVGMVFQAAVLLPWRTTLANVLFMAEMRGENSRAYRKRALELIALAGLEGFENSYPHELSGGMQQRAAICRALLLDPSLILMDEPFGALDIITRERMGFELQRIWSVSRSTVLFVTHSITEAVLLSDTVVVMSARPGRISDVVRIDLPRPRDRTTLRDPKFIELSASLRERIEFQRAE